MTTVNEFPGSIDAIMSLVAENHALLSDFERLDGGSTKVIEHTLQNRRFKINLIGKNTT